MRPPTRAQQVRSRIEDLYIASTDPAKVLPSERALAEKFGVARATVRAALKSLKDEQLLLSAPGSPAFVVDPHISHSPVLRSFTQDARARGWTPSSTVLSASVLTADIQSAHELGIVAGEQVYQVRRLRFADRVPLSVEEMRFPAQLVPNLIDLNLDGSLYALLLERYDLRVMRHDRRISAVNINAENAALLEVATGAATLYVMHTGFDQRGRRVEVGRSLYRGDRYDFSTVSFVDRASKDDRG